MTATNKQSHTPILAHQHLLAVVNRLRDRAARRLRILDIGCGDGGLLDYFHQTLTDEHPQIEFELHGFDIAEQGYNDRGQRHSAVRRLEVAHPHVNWSERIKVWRVEQDWQYPDNYFDLAVSNQVIEHVHDLSHLMRNLQRCLRPGGTSVHLFPMKHHVVEAHTRMPLLHYFRDFQTRVAWARLLNRIGLSRYQVDRQVLDYDDPQEHAADAARFVQAYTAYRSFNDIYRECNRHQLAVSHGYTPHFYAAKVCRILRLSPQQSYHRITHPLIGGALFFALKYVSSVTLVIEAVDYDIGARIANEKAHRQRLQRPAA